MKFHSFLLFFLAFPLFSMEVPIWKEINSGSLLKIENRKIFLGYENSVIWEECKIELFAQKGNAYYFYIDNDSECKWKNYNKIVLFFTNDELHIYLINQSSERRIYVSLNRKN